MGTIILSALVAHTAWHWLTDRYATLRQYRIEWPTIDALFLLTVIRWAMVLVALAAAWWFIGALRQMRQTRQRHVVAEPIREIASSER